MGPKSRSTEKAEGGFDSIKEAKDFASIRHSTQRQDNKTHKK